MAKQVCSGAVLQCTFGLAPSILFVTPLNRVSTGFMYAANIMDNMPIVNIPPFGMCSSPTNPAVVSATTAAAGVLTPMPCIPGTVSPWILGSPLVLIANWPALNDTSLLMCMCGGVITIKYPGQMSVDIP